MLAVLLVAAEVPAPAAESSRQPWEAWYSVSARVRSLRVDADLVAGGRLAMVERAASSGKLVLSLDEVLEHPWKLYWVDPFGPIGTEVKVASVVTLPEATWEGLARAEEESERSALDRHRAWFETAQRPRALDGTFAFLVIGDAKDRFRIEVAPDGRLAGVTNHLTDRWLPGPFDQFVNATANRSPGVGYWFWNRGEEVPHGYEPHTYRALAAALELLALEVPAAGAFGSSAPEPLVWRQVRERALRVLSTLAPRLDGSALASARSAPTVMSSTRESLPNGASRLRLTAAATPALPHVERETVFSSGDRPVSDRIRVHVAAPGGGSLEVEAGYRPLHVEKESP